MKKILIIDDSAFMRSILNDILMGSTINEPLEISEADGKTNALQQFKDNKPDVILVDIVMKESETEGVQFLEAIKSDFDINKVIVISSIGQESIINRCKELGVIYYLQKPFDEQEISQAVTNLFSLHEKIE